MSKLNKSERKEYKALKKEFKELFPRASEKGWYKDKEMRFVDLYWVPSPGEVNTIFTRSVCSKKDVFNSKRGKLECYRKVSQGVWLPSIM